MRKFKIYVGLGGGFGGAQYYGTYEYETQDQAYDAAYELACEKYAQYAGYHGLRSVGDIMEEDEVDEETAEETYNEEREGWLDYHTVEVTDEDDDESDGDSDE